MSNKRFWGRFLDGAEKVGFRAANKFHIFGVNVCLVFIAYQTFSFFKSYNEFFLNARKIDAEQLSELNEIKEGEPLNRITNAEKLNI